MNKIQSFCICLLALGLMSVSIPTTGGYQVGDIASNFSLKNVDDTYVSLTDFEDADGFIIIFTCNTCPYSVLYEDRIIALNEKYAPQKYPVIAINPNDPEIQSGDSFAAMKIRAAEKKFIFPYLFDEGQTVYPLYGATRTPHVYLLDKDRVVKYIGAIDDSPRNASSVSETYLENAIESLKQGNDPNPNFTKAIGCSIKTKSKSR